MPKNYYIVLGIPASSSQEDIKSAYRRLAKEFHPDHYGEGHSLFQTIQEAYSVLGDPIRRQAYDDRRQQQQMTGRERGTRESMVQNVEPEPLIPEQEPFDRWDAPLTRAFERYDSPLDTLFDRIVSNLSEYGGTHGHRSETVPFVVTLTRDQAFRGGHVRVPLPVRIQCPHCSGVGGVGFSECWRCGGAGFMEGEYPVMVSFPPNIADSHVVRLSLDRFGLQNLRISIRFRVNDLL